MTIPASQSLEDAVEDQMIHSSMIEQIEDVLDDDEKFLMKKLIFDKSSHKEVSQELGISVWTSQKRLERIRDKLGKLFPGYRNK